MTTQPLNPDMYSLEIKYKNGTSRIEENVSYTRQEAEFQAALFELNSRIETVTIQDGDGNPSEK